MKVYIGSFFDTRERLLPYRDQLFKLGHDVVSTWLNETKKMPEMGHDEFWKKLAVKDLAEIQSADLFILDTLDITPRGGREVEIGYALAGHQNRLIYLVGPVRNVFHTLADRRFDTWDECMASVRDLKDQGSVAKQPAGQAPVAGKGF